MEYEFQKQIVEALIFASDVPISESKIANFIEGLGSKQVLKIVEELNQEYSKSHRVFYITKVAGGFQFNSRREFAPWIKKLFKGRARPKLSQAALESLAIIAFKQPISRVAVDAIRGVHSGGVIKNLLERNLISIAGRAETVGRPILYGTTSEFLRYFGINDISDLPKPKEIEEIMGKLDGAEEYSEEIIHIVSNQDSADEDNTNDAVE
ncbi:MAG: SMC-Scp complex subunit ScpB [bacterium]